MPSRQATRATSTATDSPAADSASGSPVPGGPGIGAVNRSVRRAASADRTRLSPYPQQPDYQQHRTERLAEREQPQRIEPPGHRGVAGHPDRTHPDPEDHQEVPEPAGPGSDPGEQPDSRYRGAGTDQRGDR